MILNLSLLRRYARRISLMLLMLFSSSLLATSLAPCEMPFNKNHDSTPEHHHSESDVHASQSQHECCDTKSLNDTENTQAHCSMNMLQPLAVLFYSANLIQSHGLSKMEQLPEITDDKLSANSLRILRPPIA